MKQSINDIGQSNSRSDHSADTPFSTRIRTWASIIAATLALASGCGIVSAPSGEQHASTEILKERSCFAGTFDDYSLWIDKLANKKNSVDRTIYEGWFPQADYDAYKEELDCRFFLYEVDGLVIEGYYVKLRKSETERLPVIINNRGGNARYARVNFGSLFARVFPLARAGFVVIGSQYRGGGIPDGEGNNGQDEFGGKDINDVLALFDLIDQMPGADPTRIGMSGWSRGGFMTFIAATKTDRLRAIAVGGTPTDLAAELVIRPEMERVFRARIPDYDNNKEAALTARSALMWAHEIPPRLPTLILHGESDKRVSLHGATRMAEALRDLEHPTKLVVYEDGTHGLMEHNEEVMAELIAWFKKYLADN